MTVNVMRALLPAAVIPVIRVSGLALPTGIGRL